MGVNNKTLLLYLVGMTALIGGFAQNMYTPILPQAQEELGTHAFLVNLSVTLFTVAMAVMQIVFGPIVDQRGRRPIMIAGLTLFTLATFGCAFSPTIGLLLLCRVAQGIGAAAIPVVAAAVIGDLFAGRSLVRGMGTFQLILALSPALGPLIGGFIGARTGMAGIFLSLGLAAVVLLAANAALLKETLSPSATPRKFSFGGFAAVYRHPHGRRLLWTGLFQAMSTMTLLVYMPTIYLHDFGMGSQGTGISFLAMALCFMAAVKIGVVLQNRWSSVRVYVYGTWANIATYVLLAVSAQTELALLLASFCVFGLTYGLSMPIPTALFTAWFPDDRAAANGAVNIMRLMGSALGPMAGSALYLSGSSVVLLIGIMLPYAWSMRKSGKWIHDSRGLADE